MPAAADRVTDDERRVAAVSSQPRVELSTSPTWIAEKQKIEPRRIFRSMPLSAFFSGVVRVAA